MIRTETNSEKQARQRHWTERPWDGAHCHWLTEQVNKLRGKKHQLDAIRQTAGLLTTAHRVQYHRPTEGRHIKLWPGLWFLCGGRRHHQWQKWR